MGKKRAINDHNVDQRALWDTFKYLGAASTLSKYQKTHPNTSSRAADFLKNYSERHDTRKAKNAGF
jgi:hypothetical protein